MKRFFSFSAERKRAAFEKVSELRAIPASYVEKDLWVCWTLDCLFSSAELAGDLTFRGGTSLTKAFRIIERFSEDIDLAISSEALGISGDLSPADAPNPSQAEKRQRKIRQLARAYVEGQILPVLQQGLAEISTEEPLVELSLEDDENTLKTSRDPYCIFLNYPSVTGTEQTEYIRPGVKIELSAKAEGSPEQTKAIGSFVSEEFLEVFEQTTFEVTDPKRTFWEKPFIINGENTAPPPRNQKAHLVPDFNDHFPGSLLMFS